jgi:predicted thioredoxin/glutaredoxin
MEIYQYRDRLIRAKEIELTNKITWIEEEKINTLLKTHTHTEIRAWYLRNGRFIPKEIIIPNFHKCLHFSE